MDFVQNNFYPLPGEVEMLILAYDKCNLDCVGQFYGVFNVAIKTQCVFC